MINRLFRIVLLFVVVVVALAGLGGCGDMQLALTYPPPITPPSAAAQGNSVAIVRFTDARKDKKEVGAMVGAIGMGQVVLKKPDAAGSWVARALAAELTHAGFHVRVVDQSRQTRNPVVVSGTLLKLFTYDYTYAMILHSTVKFSLVVTNGGAVILNKQYTGTATRPFFGGPSAGEDYEAAMAAALQDAMTRAVPDIIKAVH